MIGFKKNEKENEKKIIFKQIQIKRFTQFI
jgi:hypothetical protein